MKRGNRKAASRYTWKWTTPSSHMAFLLGLYSDSGWSSVGKSYCPALSSQCLISYIWGLLTYWVQMTLSEGFTWKPLFSYFSISSITEVDWTSFSSCVNMWDTWNLSPDGSLLVCRGYLIPCFHIHLLLGIQFLITIQCNIFISRKHFQLHCKSFFLFLTSSDVNITKESPFHNDFSIYDR